MTPTAHLSNRLEILTIALQKNLFTKSSPWTKRIVIVPSPLMKGWIKNQLSKNLNISTGIEWVYLSQSFQFLSKEIFQTPCPNTPSSLELALTIESKIHRELCADQISPIWLPLSKIILENNPTWSEKSYKRCSSFSHDLAKLFLQYSLYGDPLTKRWEKTELYEWQQQLWNELLGPEGIFSTPADRMDLSTKKISETPNVQVHLFAHPLIAPIQFNFLTNIIGSCTPVFLYVLSPSKLFWSDLLSDYESMKILSSEEKSIHLHERNPLLSNWGKIGREMSKMIEMGNLSIYSDYVLPKNLPEQYSTLIEGDELIDQQLSSKTLLHCIQADLTLMRNPKKCKILLEETDQSIQIHVAPSTLREMEILYQQLLHLLDQDPTLCPNDILVMAPDIQSYLPSIRAIFESDDSKLPVKIFDLKSTHQNHWYNCLTQLIELSKSKWDTKDLFNLIQNPMLMEMQGWKQEDIELLKSWTAETGILWAIDDPHFQEILNHPESKQEKFQSTWKLGFSKLLGGLFMREDSSESLPPMIDGLSMTKGALLGEWISLVYSLHIDLQPIINQNEMTMNDWIEYLTDLINSYFKAELQNYTLLSEKKSLIQELSTLTLANRWNPEKLYPWSSIQVHFQELFNKKSVNYRENHQQAIRFCSLLPMRAIPSDVVALIGMEENAFPKKKRVNPFDRLKNNKEIGFIPNSTDYDRSLFLESILSCRKTLFISYKKDSEYGQIGAPSLLVSELLQYINEGYYFDGKSAVDVIQKDHPFDSFDPSYFKKQSTIHSYSQRNYQLAKSIKKIKTPSFSFLPNLFNKKTDLVIQEFPSTIHIKELLYTANNPLRQFLKKRWGIFTHPYQENFKKENFTLSNLTLYRFRQDSLQNSFDSIYSLANQSGEIPYGVWKKIAASNLKQESLLVHQQLKLFNLRSTSLFQVTLTPSVSKPTKKDPLTWHLPSPILSIQGHSIPLVGTIPFISSSGLLVPAQEKTDDLFRILPTALIFKWITEQINEFEPNLLLLKTGKTLPACFSDTFQTLSQYVEYILSCSFSPSPYYPQYAESLLFGKKESFIQSIEQSLNHFHPNPNKTLQWILKEHKRWEVEEGFFDFWQEMGINTFGHALSSISQKMKFGEKK